jgi:hypothetical protein
MALVGVDIEPVGNEVDGDSAQREVWVGSEGCDVDEVGPDAFDCDHPGDLKFVTYFQVVWDSTVEVDVEVCVHKVLL